MKTLKRIGLFLWLKVKEITHFLLTWGLGFVIFVVLIYLMVEYCPWLLVSIWIISLVFTLWKAVLKDWLKENWREVKRRIP